MRTLVAIAALAFLASPALAQQATVSDRECRQLVEHTASQGATYQPGVSARGRPVAPGDLPSLGGQIQPPESFTIDLKTALAGNYGIPSNTPLLDPSVAIGKITVEDNGRRVLYTPTPRETEDPPCQTARFGVYRTDDTVRLSRHRIAAKPDRVGSGRVGHLSSGPTCERAGVARRWDELRGDCEGPVAGRRHHPHLVSPV
jgi:hypothetical protein